MAKAATALEALSQSRSHGRAVAEPAQPRRSSAARRRASTRGPRRYEVQRHRDRRREERAMRDPSTRPEPRARADAADRDDARHEERGLERGPGPAVVREAEGPPAEEGLPVAPRVAARPADGGQEADRGDLHHVEEDREERRELGGAREERRRAHRVVDARARPRRVLGQQPAAEGRGGEDDEVRGPQRGPHPHGPAELRDPVPVLHAAAKWVSVGVRRRRRRRGVVVKFALLVNLC